MFSLPLNNNKPHRQGQWLLLERILSPHLTQHPLRLQKDLLTLSRNYCGKTSGWPVIPCHLLVVTYQEAKGHSSSQGLAPPETALKNCTSRMTSEDGLQHPGGRNGQAKTPWPEKLLEVEDTENGSPLVPHEAWARPEPHLLCHFSGYCEDNTST